MPGRGQTGAASPAQSTIVVGADQGLLATFDGAATWAQVFSAPQALDWADLGFTSPAQGVAIQIGQAPEPGRLLMTHDGGHTGAPVPLT